MLTQEQITYIMNELGLDSADVAARKTIERIVASKPDVNVDARFIAALRDDLQTKANQINYNLNNKTNNYFSSIMNKILASALVVVIVLAGGGLWYVQQNGRPLIRTEQNDIGQLLSGKYGVTNLDQESFGNLATLAIVENGGSRSQSGGGNGNAEMVTTPSATVGNNSVPGMGGDKMTILPYPAPQNFEFKYDGAEISNLPATQDVFKRTKPQQSPALVDRILNFLSFGLLDLSRFTDVKIQNFSFVEDRDYGYGMNVDVMQGSVSLYQNWEKWPQPDYGTCGGAAELENPSLSSAELCMPQTRLKPEDIPSNEEVIVATNDFLSVYGISRDTYGQPRVIDNWRAQYESAVDRTSIWIPEQVQVVYPLVLEGREVMDEGGSPSGLSLMVDARTKRVTSLYELTTKQFERSQYVGESDSKRIVDVAERGGFRNYMYNDPNGRRTVLNLDTPTVELVKIWYSNDNYRTSNELFVPAYVFPVKNWEKSGYWRKNVIVPLVRDILNSDNQPSIMPMGGDDAPIPVEPDGGIGNTGGGSGGSGAGSSYGSSAGSAGQQTEPAVLRNTNR